MPQDNYSNIYGYSNEFKAALGRLQSGVGTANPDDEILAVVMSRSDITNLTQRFENVAAVFGVENGALTVSLLGVDLTTDGSGNVTAIRVSNDHVTGGINGQEVWPNKVKVGELDAFMPAP